MFFFVACTEPIATYPMVSASATIIPAPIKTNTPKIIATPTTNPPDLILISPSGEFIAEFDNAYSHPATRPQVIKILDKNGSLLWGIPYQHGISRSDPHPSLSIYRWSKDSQYLYFYYGYGPDGGDRAFWWDGFDLQRINVYNGDIEQVLPGDREKFVAFAFSLDETQIAYTREQDNPSIIYIRNLSTGKEKTAEVISQSNNYVRVGDIHWSLSGQEIAFQTESKDSIAQTIVLNPSTMKQKVVRKYMVSTSYFQGWSEDGNLEFFDVGNGVYIVHVNPKSGETIVIGTPTSGP